VVEPTFLTLDEIVAIHRDQIARYGGSEGVRDWGLLQSAMAMPAATYGGQFLHGDVCEMAAAYLFHLVQNQNGEWGRGSFSCGKRVKWVHK
jgi:death-on-curing protein